jgi:hypothetical protein
MTSPIFGLMVVISSIRTRSGRRSSRIKPEVGSATSSLALNFRNADHPGTGTFALGQPLSDVLQ